MYILWSMWYRTCTVTQRILKAFVDDITGPGLTVYKEK